MTTKSYRIAHHRFCNHFGVRSFERDSEDLATAPVRFSGGRNSNWMNAPKDVRNL